MTAGPARRASCSTWRTSTRCRAGLVASGVECSELADEPWGRYFTCRDPDGNGLVVAKTVPRDLRLTSTARVHGVARRRAGPVSGCRRS